MKKQYNIPTIKVKAFAVSDILTGSNNMGFGGNNSGHGASQAKASLSGVKALDF